MGIGGISIWQLLIILAIVVLLFGTKRLRTLGGDLGSAIRGFRNSMQDTEAGDKQLQDKTEDGDTIDVEAERKDSQTT
jgi:sec-independent protein translocase protein TatA